MTIDKEVSSDAAFNALIPIDENQVKLHNKLFILFAALLVFLDWK